MPTLNNINIFGFCKMETEEGERKTQKNEFFGLDGVETIDGGFRSRTTMVKGIHVAASKAELNAMQGRFRSFNDGLAYVLVDTVGAVWPFARLTSFKTADWIQRTADGRVFQPYTAKFEHNL